MSQAEGQTQDSADVIEASLESAETVEGPYLDLEGDGNGYTDSKVVENGHNPFSSVEPALEHYDNLTDENVLTDPETSAEILEHYVGQFSMSDEHIIGYVDEYLEGDEPESLEGAIVMDLNLVEYDGNQHINRNEGEVAEELVEHIAEESPWSPYVHFFEEEERLFIRNSP